MLQSIPKDILQEITSHLSIPDLLQLSKVTKDFREKIINKELLQRYCEQNQIPEILPITNEIAAIEWLKGYIAWTKVNYQVPRAAMVAVARFQCEEPEKELSSKLVAFFEASKNVNTLTAAVASIYGKKLGILKNTTEVFCKFILLILWNNAPLKTQKDLLDLLFDLTDIKKYPSVEKIKSKYGDIAYLVKAAVCLMMVEDMLRMKNAMSRHLPDLILRDNTKIPMKEILTNRIELTLEDAVENLTYLKINYAKINPHTFFTFKKCTEQFCSDSELVTSKKINAQTSTGVLNAIEESVTENRRRNN